MKERPIIFSAPMVRATLADLKTQTRRVVKNAHIITCDDRVGVTDTPCPYGVPGDRLWVRETFFEYPWVCSDGIETTRIAYRATDEFSYPASQGDRWRSPIHMPRWASRITLEVVGVRVQRVQDITEEDARAEGFASRAEFAAYWDTIHGPGAWERNDWVWVVEYWRIEEGER